MINLNIYNPNCNLELEKAKLQLDEIGVTVLSRTL